MEIAKFLEEEKLRRQPLPMDIVNSWIRDGVKNKNMKPIAKAIRKAKEKYDEKKDIDFCIAQKVCPKCSGDLSYDATHGEHLDISPTPPPKKHYICSNAKCNFKYTP